MAAIGLEDGSIEIWQTQPFQKGRTLVGSRSKPVACAWTEDKQGLAVARANGITEIWDLRQGGILYELPPLPEPLGMGKATFYQALSFWSRDWCLARVAPRTIHSPDLIEIIRLPEKKIQTLWINHQDSMNNFALSNDGALLATTSWDSTVKLWNVRTGQEIVKLGGQRVAYCGVAFSPDDSRLAAGGADGSVTLWDPSNHQQVANWIHHTLCWMVQFIDDGRMMLTMSGRNDPRNLAQVALWHAPTLAEIDALEGKAAHISK